MKRNLSLILRTICFFFLGFFLAGGGISVSNWRFYAIIMLAIFIWLITENSEKIVKRTKK